ncbi:hypothetical protein K6760_001814 [Escherichia coli]|nr:hypothetical protein [Escherichia coli]
MSRITIFPGEKYGYLTIIKETKAPSHIKTKGLRYFLCSCECGVVKSISMGSLRSGAVVSCGCYHKKKITKLHNGKPITAYSGYSSWTSMLDRCRNPACNDFPHYGGRGITVCDEWSNPVNFAHDMGEKPKWFSIERIDNNKGYSPDNCRWANATEQGRNKRNNHKVVVSGESVTMSAAWQTNGMKESTFYNRLNAGMNAEDALAKPVRNRIPYVILNGEKMQLKEAALRTGISKYILRKKVRPDLSITI